MYERVTITSSFPHILPMQGTTEIYIPYDGVVKEIVCEADEIATLGKPLLMIELDEEEESECEEEVGRGTCVPIFPLNNCYTVCIKKFNILIARIVLSYSISISPQCLPARHTV